MQVNTNIKLIRELSGKKQSQFAKIIKTNLSNLKTYETTDVKPKANILANISDYAGVSIDDLLEKKLTHKDITFDNIEVEIVEKSQPVKKAGDIRIHTETGKITGQEFDTMNSGFKQGAIDADTKPKHVAIATSKDLSSLIETGRINAIALDKFADSAKANSENQAELIKMIKNSATVYADPRTAEESSALQVVLMDSLIELMSVVKKKPVSEMKKAFHRKVKEVRQKVEKMHNTVVGSK
jgi:transcriptional regulator with XRE-family HTH domain